MILSYVLFFVLGLGMGYAAPGNKGFLALGVPILFAALVAYAKGVDDQFVTALIVTVIVTAVGVVLGRLLDRAVGSRGGEPAS